MGQGNKEEPLVVGKFVAAVLVVALPCIVYPFNSLAALVIASVLFCLIRDIGSRRIATLFSIDQRSAKAIFLVAEIVTLAITIGGMYHLVEG